MNSSAENNGHSNNHYQDHNQQKERKIKNQSAKKVFEDIEHPSKKAISEAFFINLGIAASKLFAALFTGSVGMMAETFHSFGDMGNQLLLLLGIKRSSKPPDEQHPFGYGQERFLWAFVISTLIFGFSGVFAIQIGYFHLLKNLSISGILMLHT